MTHPQRCRWHWAREDDESHETYAAGYDAASLRLPRGELPAGHAGSLRVDLVVGVGNMSKAIERMAYGC